MKTLHVEFDCIVTDEHAYALLNTPYMYLEEDIMDIVELYGVSKIEIKPKED